jgi:hypothetical protein
MPCRATFAFTMEYLSQQRLEIEIKIKEYDYYSNGRKNTLSLNNFYDDCATN